jgi:hypothetical protein
MLIGWIMAPWAAREELMTMGIVLGDFIDAGEDSYFDACHVGARAMTRLEATWGRFYWALSSDGVAGGPHTSRREFR